ncbi:distal membrane-arm assembly complex protein 2 [Aricia agestis]|uniref:distal membrane-arm assembly complex protein 2 n=1 Tax=Aricia agestis TaxID=91739 RepID=UPI001C209BAF|nr:distal membrane-arm assembly complex protein 2 [Aricia agestis]
MALNLSRYILRRSRTTSRNYCEYKSLYEKHEAGKQPKKVFGQEYPEWKKPWIEREGEWKSKLSLFVERSPPMEIMNTLQKAPYVTTDDVKDWWKSMQVMQEIKNQEFLPERVAALGYNLAAVHFFTYRGCAVRLKDSNHWIIGDFNTLKLPDQYTEGYNVEAVDCSNFNNKGLRYEGVKNLTGLTCLKWLSLRNNKHIDVWCLDRIAGQNGRSLEFLNITGCDLCVGGVHAIARMTNLKMLVIDDPGDNMDLQVALAMLEEENPELLICIDNEQTTEVFMF